MKYPFPIINHIDDVLPAIEGSPEIYVSDKGDYTVINYQVAFSDTFPPVYIDDEYNLHAAIRRECRGIIFCSNTGNIIRRPYNKFFNLGEKEETLDISLAEHHHILHKLDGSMIAPFLTHTGELIFGTKMGKTDVSEPVQLFVENHETIDYIKFALEMLEYEQTPLFEWCSRKQKIVLDYPEDQLILTAIRDMKTGDYLPYDELKLVGEKYGIPVVGVYESPGELEALVTHTRDLKDAEGYVVRFSDGHMCKIKGKWYVDIHKAKESILWDRNVVEKILDNTIDDIKPHLLPDDLNRLEEFEHKFKSSLLRCLNNLCELVDKIKTENLDRKKFALELAPNINTHYKVILFSTWDNWNSLSNMHTELLKIIRKNLNSNTNYEVLRDSLLDGIKFNV